DNFYGELGNNSTTNTPVPVAVNSFGALSGKTVVAIAAAGYGYSMALCSDGTLATWGYNGDGEMGNNSTSNSMVPLAINAFGVLSVRTVTAIAAGNRYSMALCSDGTLVSWGDNTNGQLGNNATTSSLVPVAIANSSLVAGEKWAAAFAGPA